MDRINGAVPCATLAVALLVAVSASATPTQKCEEAKLKAQGKLELCLKKNSAKGIGGTPDKSAKCQTKFQTALSKAGQIGIAAGTVACRYVDRGDGTVSDLNTGLVWEQKDTTCPGAHCYSDLFTWSTGSPYEPNGTAFTTFLYGLNAGTSSDGSATSGCFAGHCDWRLPTIEELAGIVDLTHGNCGGGSGPCIDPAFGPTEASNTWSAITASSNSKGIWILHFGAGAAIEGYKTDALYVRAVRGGL